MAKSQRLRLKDVRAIYLLVGECRELGCDPMAWRRHLLTGLARTLGAAVGLSFEFERLAESGKRTDWIRSTSVVEVGWPTESDRQHFARFMQEGRFERAPFVIPSYSSNRRLHTRTRRQLVSDRCWYGSMFVHDYARPAHVDDIVLSRHQTPTGMGHTLNLSRLWGEEPFSDRVPRLLSLCHAEIAKLRGTRLAGGSAPSVSALSSRLRQVLQCLLEGDGEKQVALRLGIAVPTVHEYVKHLHRRFGVHSRSELLARCAPLLLALRYAPQAIEG